MERNMKKLAVFVIVAAITMFIAAAMASADPSFPKAIRGQYASTSAATCMIAPFGFNPDLTPIYGVGLISMQYRQGIVTFEKDGTGSVTLNASGIGLSFIGPSGPVPPSASSQTIEYDFTYTVDNDGMITIKQVPGTYFVTQISGPSKGKIYQVEGSSFKGIITPDGKNITTYTNASDLFTLIVPDFPPINLNHSCSSSGVLIWQHTEKP